MSIFPLWTCLSTELSTKTHVRVDNSAIFHDSDNHTYVAISPFILSAQGIDCKTIPRYNLLWKICIDLLRRITMIRLIPYPYRLMEQPGCFEASVDKTPTLADYDRPEDTPWLSIKVDEAFAIDGKACREAYSLRIEAERVTITASHAAGTFYGFVTLIQLMACYDNRPPCALIEDKPDFRYRGFMLDVGRYFFGVEDVKKFVDLCALHKINVFHWHLTEDQGWRIEIKRYPLLAAKGGTRSHTNFNRKPHSGFYTQNEIKEIVDYCAKRHIEVIPEIDMPGHMRAAIACYPELSCFERELPVATHWGVKHDILCAGKESTYKFVFDVLDEICELFPGKYIHLGGDEAPKMRWKLCPHCQAKMKEAGLQTEDELQSYFMNRVARYLASKGKQSIMWNETEPSGKCSADLAWQIWDSDFGKNDANRIVSDVATSGRKLIYSVSHETYLDFPYSHDWAPLEKCYQVDPRKLEDLREENILGIEAPLWTEYVPNMKRAMELTLPRLGALSEAMWSPAGGRIFTDFCARLESYYAFMRASGYEPASLKTAFPNKWEGLKQSLWFNRRVFHWEGLKNLFDDDAVKRLAAKRSSEKR